MPQPEAKAAAAPHRIVLILPCCIGDVVLATATLMALRRAYPQAHITWAVGRWSRGVLDQHPLLDALLDTGSAALPVKSVSGFIGFVRQLRAGRFDLAVSLVRSPLMSAALLLSGIPVRAGLDSAGRGFGYTIRVPVDPDQPRHEAELYLDVARALGIDVTGCRATVPVSAGSQASLQAKVRLPPRYLLLNPTGGRNPGMTMDSKRWPPENFARLADSLAARLKAHIVLIGGPGDSDIVNAVALGLQAAYTRLDGQLTFSELAALAQGSVVYVGNDTGVTHLAAAAGAHTIMILGPSDPQRYAPFTPDSLALWKPAPVDRRGVSAGDGTAWDWERDGITVDEALAQTEQFLDGFKG